MPRAARCDSTCGGRGLCLVYICNQSVFVAIPSSLATRIKPRIALTFGFVQLSEEVLVVVSGIALGLDVLL